jgi:hypothetical protein
MKDMLRLIEISSAKQVEELQALEDLKGYIIDIKQQLQLVQVTSRIGKLMLEKELDQAQELVNQRYKSVEAIRSKLTVLNNLKQKYLTPQE